MKKALLTVGVVYGLLFAGYAADLYHPPACDIMASSYGARTGDTITNIIAQVGTRRSNLILDGGTWAVSNNITFPSNMAVTVTPGSYFSIDSGYIVKFCTNELVAGHWPVFTGSGTATGTATFLYRIVEWGDTNQYNIGLGDLHDLITTSNLRTNIDLLYPNISRAAYTNISNYFLDGVTNDMQFLNVRSNATIQGNLTVNGVISGSVVRAGTLDLSNVNDLNVTGDFLVLSNDLAVSFMGYPKVTLTTNMVTLLYGDASQKAVSLASFTNVFDNNPETTSTAFTNNNGSTAVIIDAGTNYIGFVHICSSADMSEASRHYLSVSSAGGNTNLYSVHVQPETGYDGASGSTTAFWKWESPTFPSTNRLHCIVPFAGQKIILRWSSQLTVDTRTWLNTVSLYGATNQLRNAGGF